MKIYQFLETYSDADAIGYHAKGIDKLLKKNNIETAIFANNIDEKCKNCTKYYRDYDSDEKDIIIFHHSIGSDVFDFLKNFDVSKKLIFHNVTPPEFFVDKPDFARILKRGYEQLWCFNKVFSSAICDSVFNKKILRKYGYKKDIQIVPPFVNLFDKFGIPKVKQKFKKIRFLYVSQIAPHKNQKKLVKIFKIYQNYFNDNSELYIVGGFNEKDPYYSELEQEIGLNKSVHVTGKIPLLKLKNLYQTSHLFLSMSEHEGFSVPLVEAMYFGLPVVAYKAGAVGDTLGSGGVLLKNDNPLVISATIDMLMNNKVLMNKIIYNQRKVMSKYNPLFIEKKLLKWLVKN